MRRLLSFILFLCFTIGVMAQSDYGLTVAGTPVTSANKSDILGDGKVSYDPASHTLRLKNANIETGTAAVFTEDRLIIDLDGTNSFIAPRGVESIYNPTSATDYGVTICSTSGNGTLTTEGYESAISVGNSGGIYIHDCSITAKHSMSAISGYISGNNTTLKIEHANIDIQGQSTEACIAGFENLVLEKCEIVEPSNAYYKSAWGYGAMRQGDDDTKCINLKIKAKDATEYGISAAALNGTTYSVNSENYADVMGDGTISYDVEQNTLTINGAHLFGFAVMDFCKPGLRINIVGKETTVDEFFMINTACTLVGNNTKKAVTSQLNVNTLAWSSSLTIQDLAVEFIGNKQGFQSQSGTASLTLRNATVNANGAAGVFKYIPSLVLEDCEILTPEGAYYDAEKKYIVDESGNRVTGVITIGHPAVQYDIYFSVGSGRTYVTSENCNDVLGDGTVSYDADTNVLTLSTINKPTTNLWINYDGSQTTLLDGIKIKLVGDNALHTLALRNNVKSTICGGGSILLVDENEAPTDFSTMLFDAEGDMIIEDCSIVVRHTSLGMVLGNNEKQNKLTIRNANIRVESKKSCLSYLSDLVLEDCYIYSPGSARFDPAKHALVNYDGRIVGDVDILIINAGKPQFPGSGTKNDPYILSKVTTTFTVAPSGVTYYQYTATEDCVMQLELNMNFSFQRGPSGVILINGKTHCHLQEKIGVLLRKGDVAVLTLTDCEETVTFREPAEGEIWYKAIPFNEGDNTIPAAINDAVPSQWYKATVPAGGVMDININVGNRTFVFSADNADTETDGMEIKKKGEDNYTYSYTNNSDSPVDLYFKVLFMNKECNAKVSFSEAEEYYGIRGYITPTEGGEYRITSKNCNDITGDGTFSYDPTENILHLKGTTIHTCRIEKGCKNGIRVMVHGDNHIKRNIVNNGIPWAICGNGAEASKLRIGNENAACINTDGVDLTVENVSLEFDGPWGFYGNTGTETLTLKNVSAKIIGDKSVSRSDLGCITNIKNLILEGCKIISPAGAHFDAEKLSVVDKDGNPVKGELIILKDTPQFSGSGTKDDPYILGEGTNTFTTPVGETYYKYTATKDCVMQIEVDEQSGVTGDILFGWHKDGDIENREILLHDGSNVVLRIVSTDPDNKVTVKIRDVADGEIWYKAIPLKEGDNPLPTIVWQKQLVMWYKLLVPKGKYMIATFTKDVQFHFSENDAEHQTYGMVSNWIDTHNSTANEDYVIFVRVSSMPEGGNANVKYEDAVEKYGIWVNKTREDKFEITGENCTDVLGDGTMSYDPVENVLSLNNVQASDRYILIGELAGSEGFYYSFEKMELLNKKLAGIKVKVTGDNALSGLYFRGGVNGTICGGGNLLLKDPPIINFALYSMDNLLIEDCNISCINIKNDFGISLWDNYLTDKKYPIKLTVRNASIKVESELACLGDLSEFILEGCTILAPDGAYFDPAQHAVVDKDGNPVTGELIIGKPTTPEKGTGSKEDPFVLDDTLDKLLGGGGTGGTGGGGTGTGTGIDGTGTGKYPNPPVVVTPPAGTNSYYSYTAKEDCVLGMAVSGECESSAVTINGNSAGSIENREILLRKGNVAVLNFVNPATGYSVAINLREPGEGEIWYKAIALNKGDNAVPAVNEAKNVALWYKANVPAGQTMTLSLDAQGKVVAFAADNADAESDGKAVESDGSGMIYSYVNTTATAIDLCVKFEDMKAGCNANVKFEVPFIPEEGTGSKEDPFKLDDTLDKLLGGGGSGGSGGGGTGGTGGGSGTGGTGGGTGTGTGIDGTGTGKYPTPPVVITPPAGTDSYYSYTAKTDCVLGIAVKAGNVFEGKLTINGKDAGNIEEREILLLAGDAALLYVKNAEEGDKLLINLRPVDEGEIWYKPIELVEGDNDIPVVVEGKNLDLWYKVRVASDKAMILNTNVKGTMLAFAAKDAEKQERPVALKNTETGMTYTVANTSAEDLEVCFMVKSMPAACVANVAFDSASEHPDKEAPTLDNAAITVDDVTETTISLSWTAATDDRTPQEVLEYIVECTDVATGTKTEHAVGSDTQYVLTDLMSGNAYLLNVMVRDEAGNSAHYEPIEVNTISGIGSVTLDPSASGVRKYIDKHRVRISRGNSIYDANGRVVK